MQPVTIEQIREAVVNHKIRAWRLRKCSMCRVPLSYYFDDDGKIFYDSSCDCTNFREPLQPRSWEELADTFNRQMPSVREQMWTSFIASGTPTPPPPETGRE